LNRGRHLYSAGRPSRWALAHISSYIMSSLCRVCCSNRKTLRAISVANCCRSVNQRNPITIVSGITLSNFSLFKLSLAILATNVTKSDLRINILKQPPPHQSCVVTLSPQVRYIPRYHQFECVNFDLQLCSILRIA